MSNLAEPRIVCAAIRDEDGQVVVGPRHMDKTMRETIMNLKDSDSNRWRCAEQGFIDQFGKFYTRTEAWQVAEKNNQIHRRCGGDSANGGTLYSENLY